MRTSLLAAAMLLTGCGTSERLPEPGPGDCQIRAGAALTEGTASFTGVGGVSADARGGAYTRVGKCDDNDFVFARTDRGFACRGPAALCLKAIEQSPVTMPRAEYEALLQRLREVD